MTIATGVAVRDTILWVEDSGETDLPPIVCLHSLFLDGTMFDALIPAAKGRFRVIRPDFRGQGSSAPSTESIVTMESCADDINALVDLLKLPPVHLIGASMGGDVAVRMVARRPELIASLTMMGSSVRDEPAEQKAHFRELVARTEPTGFVGADLDLMMSIMFGATTRARPEAAGMLDHWRTRIGMLRRSTWPAISGVVERSSAVSLMAGIRVPALVYSSNEDIARPLEWSREVASGISGATLVPLDGVGHSPILEVPEIVIPQTLDFIASAASQIRS